MSIKQEPFCLLDKIVLGRAVFTPPVKVSSSLENEARFVYVVNGRSRLYAPQDRVDLKTGDSFLMRCENFVNNWYENEDGSQNEVIILHFYPEVLRFIYDDKVPEVFSPKPGLKAGPIARIYANDLLDNYINSLRFYLNNPSFLTSDLIKVKVQELVLLLVNADSTGSLKGILSSLFKSGEYEFKEIIRSHLFEDLKIEDLAFFAGLSLSSFKRKFNSIFGTSPTRYIKAKRLEKAQHLLSTTDLRVSDIAYDCGFNDVGYFSKSFQAAYQCSPSEYRRAQVG